MSDTKRDLAWKTYERLQDLNLNVARAEQRLREAREAVAACEAAVATCKRERDLYVESIK